jgi:hypothetical protein
MQVRGAGRYRGYSAAMKSPKRGFCKPEVDLRRDFTKNCHCCRQIVGLDQGKFREVVNSDAMSLYRKDSSLVPVNNLAPALLQFEAYGPDLNRLGEATFRSVRGMRWDCKHFLLTTKKTLNLEPFLDRPFRRSVSSIVWAGLLGQNWACCYCSCIGGVGNATVPRDLPGFCTNVLAGRLRASY